MIAQTTKKRRKERLAAFGVLSCCLYSYLWPDPWCSQYNTDRNRQLSSSVSLSPFHISDWIVDDEEEEWQSRELKENDPVNSVILDSSSQYRFLSFGTSISWGAGLANRFDAFPYLLGGRDEDDNLNNRSNVTNLSQRASGPGFPSICLETMLSENSNENKNVDVILLEFYLLGGNGLPILSRRLKQLYPNALFIILQIWYPQLIGVHGVSGEYRGDLKSWAKQVHDIEALDDVRLLQVMKQASDTNEYSFQWSSFQRSEQIEQASVELVNGMLYQLPKPIDPIDAVEQYQTLFSSRDWHHLNEKGHGFVAQEVYTLIESAINEKKNYSDFNAVSDNIEPMSAAAANEKYIPSDVCYDWFQTGTCELQYDSNLQMETIVNNTAIKKFGLSFPLQQSSSFHVVNPHPTEEMELYLRYMVTGPAPSDYPKTSVAINGVITLPEIDVDQHIKYSHFTHVAAASHVGTVIPGDNVITLTPLEPDKPFPFRLVTVAMVKKEVIMSDDALDLKMLNFMRFKKSMK